ncbi:MAG: ABC transporter permease [Eubacteriales bacterium]|nr:ABC transporter permease [Eubacteriales bacterium]
MQKILTKRVFRNLKTNLFRYLALAFMIMFCMFIVVALIGAAETVIHGTKTFHEESKVESGQFTTFIPLTDEEIAKLESLDVEIEKHFSMDFAVEDTTLRVFRVREKIDLLGVNEGELPSKEGQIALDPRYCAEHNLKVGDSISIGGKEYRISCIAAVADYDDVKKEFGDAATDCYSFGVAFVGQKDYEQLYDAENRVKSEEYLYAYRLNGTTTDEDVKEYLEGIEIQADQIDDEYFKDYWERTAGQKDEYLDAMDELVDGVDELKDGTAELTKHNEEINAGATDFMNATLADCTESLRTYGLQKDLTAENYKEELKQIKERMPIPALITKIDELEKSLESLHSYQKGVKDYTDGVADVNDGMTEVGDGVQELRDKTKELIDEYFDIELNNLQSFIVAEDNIRISAAANDQVITLYAGMFCGALIIVMFAYVISVFVVHGIEQESSVIGALYALGVKRKQLMLHYISLPVVVTFISCLIGTLVGCSKWGIGWQTADAIAYYSLPILDVYVPAYLLMYGIVMPPILAAIVNVIVIRKKLSKPALSLIRNEQKIPKNIKMNFKGKHFVTTFKIKQMIRESRTAIAVVIGMFVTMLLMMIGLDCQTLCKNVQKLMTEDTKYEYMYTYKYPEKHVPEGGEAAYAYTFSKEIMGYKFDVTLLGIDEDNPYFDTKLKKSQNSVVISSAMASKFQLKEGDKLIVSDDDKDYVFHIDGVTKYATSMYAFMDLESMRELFGQDDDYYNVVFSDHALDIPSGRLFAETSRSSIERASGVFTQQMRGMVTMMVSVSAIIFVIVLFLMMRVMIDRAAFNISLIKIFGYRKHEIRKLYLDGNFYVVAIGALICLPLSKCIMDMIFPLFVSNVACVLEFAFPIWEYVIIYVGILVSYFIINRVLVYRINKILPAEVLKNRE